MTPPPPPTRTGGGQGWARRGRSSTRQPRRRAYPCRRRQQRRPPPLPWQRRELGQQPPTHQLPVGHPSDGGVRRATAVARSRGRLVDDKGADQTQNAPARRGADGHHRRRRCHFRRRRRHFRRRLRCYRRRHHYHRHPDGGQCQVPPLRPPPLLPRLPHGQWRRHPLAAAVAVVAAAAASPLPSAPPPAVVGGWRCRGRHPRCRHCRRTHRGRQWRPWWRQADAGGLRGGGGGSVRDRANLRKKKVKKK